MWGIPCMCGSLSFKINCSSVGTVKTMVLRIIFVSTIKAYSTAQVQRYTHTITRGKNLLKSGRSTCFNHESSYFETFTQYTSIYWHNTLAYYCTAQAQRWNHSHSHNYVWLKISLKVGMAPILIMSLHCSSFKVWNLISWK